MRRLLLHCALALVTVHAKRKAPSSQRRSPQQRQADALLESSYQDGTRTDSAAVPSFDAALAAEDLEDYEQAEALYRRALEADPAHGPSASNLGALLRASRRPKEAEAVYRELIEQDERNFVVRYNLGNLLKERGRLPDAAKMYEACLNATWRYVSAHPKQKTPMPAAASTNLGNTLQELGDYTHALPHHRLVAELSPDTPDAQYNLGVTLIALNNTKEATALWKATVKRMPSFLGRLLNAGPWTTELLAEERAEGKRLAKKAAAEADSADSAANARLQLLPQLTDSLRAGERSVRRIVTRFEEIFFFVAPWGDGSARPPAQIDQRSFAYGSSFLPEILAFVRGTAVLQEGLRPQAGGLVVLGSSTGWLGFWAHLAFGTPVIGYDLLCSQVHEARRIAKRYGLLPPKGKRAQGAVRFLCANALEADLSNAGVVWLTSAVWSVRLRGQVYAKLMRELPMGGVVVDYHHALASAVPDSPFELVNATSMSTSWNHKTQVFVMRRKDPPVADEQQRAKQERRSE